MKALSLPALFLVLVCQPIILDAQKTAFYYHPNHRYNEAVELLDNEHYVSARKSFEELLNTEADITQPELKEIRINSAYYRTICAIELLNPDAEMLALRFISDYPSHAKTEPARFYLGKYYYYQRKYRQVIDQMEDVDDAQLSYEQQTDRKFELAYAYFATKDFTNAKRLFADVKGTEKYQYPASYYHGFILFEEGDLDGAMADFTVAEGSNYYGKVIPYYKASIMYEQGRLDDMIAYIEPLLNEPGRVVYEQELNLLLGKAYFDKGQYQKALPYLENYAWKSKSMEPQDFYMLGFAQYKTGQYRKAIDNFKELSRERTALGQNAMYLLGKAYLEDDQKSYARTSFGEAARIDDDPFVQENAMFNYGKLSYEMGYPSQAITTFEDFLEKYPNSTYSNEVKELLADLFLITRNYQQALTMIEGIEKKTPKLRIAYQKVAYFRGVELYNDKAMDEAEEMFNKSLEAPIDGTIQALSYFWLAEIAYQNKEYNVATSDYNRFMDLAKNKEVPFESSPATANYGLGYSYLKNEKYSSALSFFDKSMSEVNKAPDNANTKPVKDRLVPDLILRTADCQFMLDRKQEAMANYTKVIDKRYPGADYALYQRAAIYGLQENLTNKVSDLESLTRNYKKSRYYDIAYFELGDSYFKSNQYTKAINTFEGLIKDRPNSPFVIQAKMKTALVYYNMGENKKAIRYYQEVADSYPGTAESREASQRLKDIAIETGDDSHLAGTIDISEQDSVQFRIAEKQYLDANYPRAENELNKYLNQFPKGAFKIDAHFYRADIFYRKKDYTNALIDYEVIIGQPGVNQYSEVALLRAAKISQYEKQDYTRAYRYYERLLPITTFKQNAVEALKGLVISGFEIKNYAGTQQYAQQLLAEDQADQELKILAHFYLGKAAYEQGNMETAMVEFTKTTEMTSNEKAAEAQYYMASIQYSRGNLKQAEATCEDIIKTYSYTYWQVRSFILIADIYVARYKTNNDVNDLLQAQATLQSIVDGYTGDAEVANEARQKLEAVNKMLDQNSRLRDNDDGDFFIDPNNN